MTTFCENRIQIINAVPHLGWEGWWRAGPVPGWLPSAAGCPLAPPGCYQTPLSSSRGSVTHPNFKKLDRFWPTFCKTFLKWICSYSTRHVRNFWAPIHVNTKSIAIPLLIFDDLKSDIVVSRYRYLFNDQVLINSLFLRCLLKYTA